MIWSNGKNSVEEEDDDTEDDSDYNLEFKSEMAKDYKPRGESKSKEVEKEVCWRSGTKVAKSRSGVGKETNGEACNLMMGMGNQKIGSTDGTSKSQSIDDHVLTPGYVRSLRRSSLIRPGLELEVALGHNQGTC
ncbi:hypothetical protein ACSBR1_025935 [Camellia fascicularis]